MAPIRSQATLEDAQLWRRGSATREAWVHGPCFTYGKVSTFKAVLLVESFGANYRYMGCGRLSLSSILLLRHNTTSIRASLTAQHRSKQTVYREAKLYL